MMLEPSVDELLEKVNSKYALVILSAKRARELQTTKDPMVDEVTSHKLVGVALEEIQAEHLDTDSHDYE
ncbi:DNA-directed RNA polymerase subunit omega [Salinibacillus xinjiangensis]|uniref:DNA-directed RNA polymerase subunit omega n=1 Tax=Salinibacillus xinjiangensis TaxID=1229268 RepID=A0A6G1X3C3_9BACI|nr:DNA-directed RNA polymerase subunit omega [Salinibacillus xinjiangensis]MRG85454.1 DNA-directed RNA polymerase subunit omega [Salinibacillus xinjiangensis]